MKFDWNLAGALAAAALAAGCGAAASDEPGPTCPGGGSAVEVDGYALCAYEQSIIETGFRCPPAFPVAYQDFRGVVCSSDPNLPQSTLDRAFALLGDGGGGGSDGEAGSGGMDGGEAGSGGAGGSVACTPATETLVGHGALDVLLVIDNSGSMSPYQQAIATNAALLVDPLVNAGVDFQLGVTTTGIEQGGSCPGGAQGAEAGRLFPVDGSSPRILSQATPNLADVLGNNVNVGDCHGIEQGLRAAALATGVLAGLADDPATPAANDGNLGFLRPEAQLAVIFLSDEEDQSPGCGSYVDPATGQTVIIRCDDELIAHKPAGRISAHGIVGLATSNCMAEVGSGYLALVNRVGGSSHSICDPMGATLAAIASQLVTEAAPTVWTLSGTPVDGNGDGVIDDAELSVEVDGNPIPMLTAAAPVWFYDANRNALVFPGSFAPSAGSTVALSYCP